MIFLAVVVYAYLIAASDNSTGVRSKFAQLAVTDLVVPIACSLVSYFLRFFRWRLILRQLEHRISWQRDLIFYLSGFALTMTPGKSGETIRSAFLLQAGVPIRTSLSAFILERSLDLLVVAMLAALLFVDPLIMLLGLIVVLALLSVVGSKLKFGVPHNAKGFLNSVLIAASQISVVLRPLPIFSCAILGCAAWVSQGMGFYFIVSLFAEDADMIRSISTYCAGLFIGAASLVPGGVGVTEGSLAWLLQTQGLDQSSAILAALLSRGCTLWLAVAVGCGALVFIIKGQTISYDLAEFNKKVDGIKS